MTVGILILLGEAAVAYLVMDLIFRFMPLEDVQRAIPRTALVYGLTAAGLTAGAAYLGWVWGEIWGFLVSLLGPLVWWPFWQFGIRKQFGAG